MSENKVESLKQVESGKAGINPETVDLRQQGVNQSIKEMMAGSIGKAGADLPHLPLSDPSNEHGAAAGDGSAKAADSKEHGDVGASRKAGGIGSASGGAAGGESGNDSHRKGSTSDSAIGKHTSEATAPGGETPAQGGAVQKGGDALRAAAETFNPSRK